MINSRNIDDLLPEVKEMVKAFIALCDKNGIDIIITSTYRDNESQTALYNQGRTTKGAKVTNAKAGESYHNYRCAVDFAPVVNGKINWNDTATFTKCGKFAEQCGLEWAGRWKSFPELAHVQYTGGLSIKDLKAGKKIVFPKKVELVEPVKIVPPVPSIKPEPVVVKPEVKPEIKPEPKPVAIQPIVTLPVIIPVPEVKPEPVVEPAPATPAPVAAEPKVSGFMKFFDALFGLFGKPSK
jgi:peptidoglycan L-alanyl-D-glutamate endopeptidase CwlK